MEEHLKVCSIDILINKGVVEMERIKCSVDNCSHNCSQVCYSNRVNIVGYGAEDKDDTCCGSFLDVRNYSNLTNNTNGSGPCDCLVCKAEQCIHNKNQLCTLESIQVGCGQSNIYSETLCQSFEK